MAAEERVSSQRANEVEAAAIARRRDEAQSAKRLLEEEQRKQAQDDEAHRKVHACQQEENQVGEEIQLKKVAMVDGAVVQAVRATWTQAAQEAQERATQEKVAAEERASAQRA